MWLKLHPKVKAAFAAAIALGITDVGAQVTGHYPHSPYVGIGQTLIVALSGYFKGVSQDAA